MFKNQKHNGKRNKLFEKEIEKAVDWLLDVQDPKTNGWGWIQHIPPNEQNTSEVICAILNQDINLNDSIIEKMHSAINNFLLEPDKNAVITMDYVWVLRALQLITAKHDIFEGKLDINNVLKAKKICINWLLQNQNDDGGWSDIKGESSIISRTAIVIRTLSDALIIQDCNNDLQDSIDAAVKWLIKNKNRDGGWGNNTKQDINRMIENHINMPSIKLEYQYKSNPACTSYAILALCSVNKYKYRKIIKKAADWLVKNQDASGSWKVFWEVGIRKGIIFTFRHFSTAWALMALLQSDYCDFQDDVILDGMDYLLNLQDPISGGWRTSFDTDPFTWATCNALELLNIVQIKIENLSLAQLISIIKEWRFLKLSKEVQTWRYRNIFISFNNNMSLLFSLTFSSLCLLFLVFCLMLNPSKSIKLFLCITSILAFCIPWIFHIYYCNKEISWLKAITLVCGSIMAVALALVGFFIK